jgi:hydrogenase-4 component F
MLRTNAVIAGIECIIALCALRFVHAGISLFAFQHNFFIDSLSAYHIGLVSLVFFTASIYAFRYFANHNAQHADAVVSGRRYGVLWNAFFTMLISALCSNNLGILWIAIESSTLFSALLIQIKGKPVSIEAMWKYLLICSVGIALAFIGTLLLSVASQAAPLPEARSILWTVLVEHAGSLDKHIMMAAFLFVLVGFGTKAGLAPMHTWLPDAHSQAPTPVSAVFSGVMLNVAFYCIMRYLPLVEGAGNKTMEAHGLLIVFGIVSILAAAVFIPAQKDIKRMLAYCSVEHMGIIVLGIGIGGAGTFAALFHTLNHSLAKTLAFFSAGRLVQDYGTNDMRKMSGAAKTNPLWGSAFFIAVLALIGMAPFSLFMSEFQILKSTIDTHHIATFILFIAGTLIIFIAMLKFGIEIFLGKPEPGIRVQSSEFPEYMLVIGTVILLVILGIWMPGPFKSLLLTMTAIVNQTTALPGGIR